MKDKDTKVVKFSGNRNYFINNICPSYWYLEFLVLVKMMNEYSELWLSFSCSPCMWGKYSTVQIQSALCIVSMQRCIRPVLCFRKFSLLLHTSFPLFVLHLLL